MKWYLDKRNFVSLALKNVTCPWHFKMFTWFSHPVIRVSSQTCFSLQICLYLLRDVWGHLSLPRHLSPPGRVKNFLHGKRVLLGWSASHLHSLGKHSIDHHKPGCHMVVAWAESFPQWSTDKVHPDDTHGQSSSRISTNKVTSPHSAAKSQAVQCLPSIRLLHTLSLREITLVSFNFLKTGTRQLP